MSVCLDLDAKARLFCCLDFARSLVFSVESLSQLINQRCLLVIRMHSATIYFDMSLFVCFIPATATATSSSLFQLLLFSVLILCLFLFCTFSVGEKRLKTCTHNTKLFKSRLEYFVWMIWASNKRYVFCFWFTGCCCTVLIVLFSLSHTHFSSQTERYTYHSWFRNTLFEICETVYCFFSVVFLFLFWCVAVVNSCSIV